MFLGNLDQWEKDAQYVPAHIRPFIEMLAHVDFDTIETGRHDLGNGNYMNVDESVTAPAGERKTECHSRYIDIQVLVDGSEYIGWQPLCRLGEVTEDRSAQDARFFSPFLENDVFVVMERRKTFAVFYPNDGHRCLCAPDGRGAAVRKIIVKVRVQEEA